MDIKKYCDKNPVIEDLVNYRETIWFNPRTAKCMSALPAIGIGNSDINEAATRLDRFRPYIAQAFPETQKSGGIIESPLLPLPALQRMLSEESNKSLSGKLLLKCDHLLPVSGSIKARGGIYEVLKHAELIASKNNVLRPTDSYIQLATAEAKKLFSQHKIGVGSTGNLGLSIGIMGATFGFQVTVHMSADAREWKKRLLRSLGVTVVEHSGDYSQAVMEGRVQADRDPNCHFVDDENSVTLFLGYAVAALRLEKQLVEMDIKVDSSHPLFVYLPCGVGGGPGGITFGLKHVFGDNVRCFLAEPTHSPCMLLGLATGLHDQVSVRDFGLDNKTEADGLAVSRPSGFVGRNIGPLIDGVFTVKDMSLFQSLVLLSDTENIKMEPSALAGLTGPARIESATSYLTKLELKDKMHAATHIVWGTGGSMVPQQEMDSYYQKGRSFIDNNITKL